MNKIVLNDSGHTAAVIRSIHIICFAYHTYSVLRYILEHC